MSAETFVDLIEEMVDIKVQQHAESLLKASPSCRFWFWLK